MPLWIIVSLVLALLLQVWNSPRREQRGQERIREYFQLTEPGLRHGVGVPGDVRRSPVTLATSVPVVSVVVVVVVDDDVSSVSHVVVLIISSCVSSSLLQFVFGR